MSETIKIRKVLKGRPTIEGAGVHLKRVFGYSQVPTLTKKRGGIYFDLLKPFTLPPMIFGGR